MRRDDTGEDAWSALWNGDEAHDVQATCWPPSADSAAGGSTWKRFYGCLYFAALRPSEAVMLRESDLHLPRNGWGRRRVP